MLHLPELEALPEDIDPKRTRDLIKEIGSVQFCDLIPAMDALTNFSEICAGEFPGTFKFGVSRYAQMLSSATRAKSARLG